MRCKGVTMEEEDRWRAEVEARRTEMFGERDKRRQIVVADVFTRTCTRDQLEEARRILRDFGADSGG